MLAEAGLLGDGRRKLPLIGEKGLGNLGFSLSLGDIWMGESKLGVFAVHDFETVKEKSISAFYCAMQTEVL